MLFGWAFGEITAPDPVPHPCYEQVENKFIPYVCEEDK